MWNEHKQQTESSTSLQWLFLLSPTDSKWYFISSSRLLYQMRLLLCEFTSLFVAYRIHNSWKYLSFSSPSPHSIELTIFFLLLLLFYSFFFGESNFFSFLCLLYIFLISCCLSLSPSLPLYVTVCYVCCASFSWNSLKRQTTNVEIFISSSYLLLFLGSTSSW